jgi:hypothetical protein
MSKSGACSTASVIFRRGWNATTVRFIDTVRTAPGPRAAFTGIAGFFIRILHLIAGLLAYRMLDAVTCKTTAEGARYRGEDAGASAADLVADQSARNRAADCAETRRRLGRLNRIDPTTSPAYGLAAI